jgi:hypothetical protein
MTSNLESTITEADFKKPLLDPKEEQLARELRGDSDLEVDGLGRSLLSTVLSLFGAAR